MAGHKNTNLDIQGEPPLAIPVYLRKFSPWIHYGDMGAINAAYDPRKSPHCEELAQEILSFLLISWHFHPGH